MSARSGWRVNGQSVGTQPHRAVPGTDTPGAAPAHHPPPGEDAHPTTAAPPERLNPNAKNWPRPIPGGATSHKTPASRQRRATPSARAAAATAAVTAGATRSSNGDGMT
ncbi:hypothetical protein GCM10010103_20910 [Streptomyces paradoxus]